MAGDLSYALHTAASGLLANQRAMDVVANNVANVNTPGFSRKIVRFEGRVLAGAGAGVELGPLMRTIDEGLLKSIRLEREGLGALSVQDDYYVRISDLFGSPESNTSLSHRLADLQGALRSLALAPHDAIEQREVVRRAEDVTLNLRHGTATIQNLRADADGAIAKAVEDINGLVTQAAELTANIVRDKAVGRDTLDAEDQRDRALDRLAGLIDIRVFSRGGGDIAVLTSGGRALLDGSAVALEHHRAAVVDAASAHTSGAFDAITIGTGATAKDITAEIRGGSLAGLIEMRDGVLPGLQDTLDTLAAELRDKLNRVHNAGLPYPGLSRLDGSRHFTEPAQQTITFAASEDTRLVLLNAAGAEVRSTSVRTLIGGADATVSAVAAQIDGWLGADGSATLVDGALQIRIDGPGLALGLRDEELGAPGSARIDAAIAFDADADGQTDETAKGFSAFFGLNDLFVDQAPSAAQSSAVLANDFVATAATLSFRNAAGALGGPVAIAAGDDLATIADKIGTATGLAATIVPAGAGLRLRLAAADGAAFTVSQDPGAGDALLDDLGLAPAATGLAGRIAVRADILASPQQLSHGALQWDPGLGAAGGYHTGVADDTTVHALAAAFETPVDFPSAGRLGAIRTTLAGYATTILGDAAALDESHGALSAERGELVESLQAKSDGLRGVNLDEEMTGLMLYEQAYAASARVFGVVKEMFDTLERMLG
jgi:flagellar hook-associated protein 1 FlgK